MTIAEDILQGFRAWLQAAGDSGGTPLTDAQVIPSEDKGPRPPLPYVTVKVGPPAIVGVDEYLSFANVGQGTEKIRGLRRSTVTCTSYGLLAAEWVRYATLVSGLQPSLTILDAAGLSITETGVVDLSALIDTEFENRVLTTFSADINYESVPSAATPNLLTAQATATWDPEGATLVDVISVTPP